MRFLLFSIFCAFARAGVLLTYPDGDRIPDSYIIVLNPQDGGPHVPPLALQLGGTVGSTFWIGNFMGFSGTYTEEAAAALAKDPAINYNSPNQVWGPESLVMQQDASWNLARISHNTPDTNYPAKQYVLDDSAGAGTCIYVVDSGISTQFKEFEGRATNLANYADSVEGDPYGCVFPPPSPFLLKAFCVFSLHRLTYVGTDMALV